MATMIMMRRGHSHRHAGDRAGSAQEHDQRDEAAEHENIAMGEIDHADNAVNHGVSRWR